MNNPNKYLVIKRLIRQKNGERTWQQEIVRDPVVIKSYLRQRQMIEEEATRYDNRLYFFTTVILIVCIVLRP